MTTFIESEINNQSYQGFEEEDKTKKISLYWPKILLILFIFFTIALPFVLYLCIFDGGDFSKNIQVLCSVDKIYRLPCGKENITEIDCQQIFCCFETATNSCYHSEPSNYYYYQESNEKFVPNEKYTPLGQASLGNLKMSIIEESQKLRIILNDTKVSRKFRNGKYSSFDIIENENKKLSVTVYRKNTKEVLLTTLKGPLIASEEYIEWTFQLMNTSGVIFGLGELKFDLNENSTITKIIYKNQNDHNTLPIFMAYHKGKYHAALIHHDGALQVTVLPSYLISLRNLYGRKIEIQLLDGPNPKDIYEKLKAGKVETGLIPEWAFGVHICREEPAKNLNSLLDQYKSFASNTAKYAKFSYESECIHDDLLLHVLAENYTAVKITEMFKELNLKVKFLMSYPPQVPIYSNIFNKYKTSTIFHKNDTTGDIYVGKYKGFEVAFPDYKNKDIKGFVSDIKDLFVGIEISGFTFTNSWPEDESYQMGKSSEPFVNEMMEEAFSNTIPWNLKENNNFHVRYHNEYGPTLEKTIQEQFTQQTFSFSSVSNVNTYEPLITQNLNTSWTDLKNSLRMSLYNSLFGHTLISLPVCGSTKFYDKKFNEDLCLRWYIFAATMPLMRISSRGDPRDPTNLYSKYTNNKAIEVLEKRRSLIPYYRTILNDGGPIIRPMFFNFPDNENVHTLDEQYMIGEAILMAQPLTQDTELMRIYLPPKIIWYEFWGGLKYSTKKGEEWIKFPIFKSDWVSFVMEGHIITKVYESDTGNKKMSLIVAMNCTTKTCQASGNVLLYFPDQQQDVAVKFEASEKKITVKTIEKYYNVIKNMITEICFYTYTEHNCDDTNPQQYIV